MPARVLIPCQRAASRSTAVSRVYRMGPFQSYLTSTNSVVSYTVNPNRTSPMTTTVGRFGAHGSEITSWASADNSNPEPIEESFARRSRHVA